jgi:hypothetical protein
VSDDSSVSLAELSRVLFGQELRLELMIAIAKSDGLVCLTDLAETLNIRNASRLQRPLDALKAAKLLMPAEALGTSRRWLRRTPSKVWDWVLEVEQQLQEGAFR